LFLVFLALVVAFENKISPPSMNIAHSHGSPALLGLGVGHPAIYFSGTVELPS
jgi:hypothetical protein